jgi:eukaryotic-like serine/threonine-protein kinase
LTENASVAAEVQPHAPRTVWIPWAVAGLFLALAMLVSLVHFREVLPEAQLLSVTILPPEGHSFGDDGYNIPVFSPDGTRIVFVARTGDGKRQLWVRPLDASVAQPIPGTDSATYPFWSPDSRYLAFATPDNILRKADLIRGGPPVTVTSLPRPLRGGTWNEQGVIVFGVNGPDSLYRVPAAGGNATLIEGLYPANRSIGPRNPQFLPDQKHFLFIVPTDVVPFPVCVASLDEPGKLGKEVARAHSNAVYAGGHLLYLRENTLVAQPFDPKRLETAGEAVPIAENIPTFGLPGRVAFFAVSPNGLLAYQTGGAGAGARLIWMDRAGKELKQIGDAVYLFNDLRLSPDEKVLAATIQDQTSAEDIWLYDLARDLKTRFTFDPAYDRDAVWTPDGKSIIWRSNRKAAGNLYRKASDGTGAEELLYADAPMKVPGNISPDGKTLLYFSDDPRGGKMGSDLWVLPLVPEQPGTPLKPRAFIQTPFAEFFAHFSPDGKWVAYTSDESGRIEVYVVPYPGPGGKRQISTGGGNRPLWRSDGKEIFYQQTGDLMAAEIAVRNGSFEVGKVQKLFGGIGSSRGYLYAPAAGGQKFIVSQQGAEKTSQPYTLVHNWPALLKK